MRRGEFYIFSGTPLRDPLPVPLALSSFALPPCGGFVLRSTDLDKFVPANEPKLVRVLARVHS